MHTASDQRQVTAWLVGLLPLASIPASWLLLERFAPTSTWTNERETLGDVLLSSASPRWLVALGLVTVLALAHSARVLVLSLRQARTPPELALLPLLIPGVLAILATDAAYQDVFRARTNCGPASREDLIVAASGEVLGLPIAWLTLVGVAIALVGVATLFGRRQMDRVSRLALATSVVAIGLSILLNAKILGSARWGLMPTLTKPNAWDQLAPVVQHFREDSRTATLLLLSGLLLAAGAAFRLWRREAAGRALSAALVVALVAVGVRAELAFELRLGPQYFAGLAPYGFRPALEGTTLDESSVVEGIRKDREFCAKFLCERPAMASLSIDGSVDVPTLEAALGVASRNGARLVALVRRVPEPENAPAVFEAARLREAARVESWRLGIRYDDESACETAGGGDDYEWWLHPCHDIGPLAARKLTEVLAESRAAEQRGEVAVVRIPRSAQAAGRR